MKTNLRWIGMFMFALLTFSAYAQPIPQILIADSGSDRVYTANLDGSGSPSILISNAVSRQYGPTGIDVDFGNGLIFINDGNGRETHTGPIVGGIGSPALPNSNPPSGEHFEVYVDEPNARYFFTTDQSEGVWVAATDGTGSSSRVWQSGESLNNAHGFDYDSGTNTAYVGSNRSQEIVAINVSTGFSTLLYNNVDGITGVRGLEVNPASGRMYWAQFAGPTTGGSIMTGNMDGSGTPSVLFNVPLPFLPHSILIDPGNNKIYWSEFRQFNLGSRVMVANLDGSGSPNVLHDMPTVINMRGLAFGQPLTVVSSTPIPTVSEWGLILLFLGFLAFGSAWLYYRNQESAIA